ncbi:MAG TPA: zinc ribbon domain-containing protein [Anaerolineae bacterium]|nr:zinc ribbon domain-containing protein [Anaerolineae bacterium]
MPLYEFKCGSCGCVFERLVLGSSSEAPTCTGCGGSDVKKLVSSFGFTSSSRRSFGDSCTTCSSSNCSTCGR